MTYDVIRKQLIIHNACHYNQSNAITLNVYFSAFRRHRYRYCRHRHHRPFFARSHYDKLKYCHE